MHGDKKKPDALIKLMPLENGFIIEFQLDRPISSNGKVWEEDWYVWSPKSRTYIKENSVRERNLFIEESTVVPKHYYHKENSNISIHKAYEELRDFVMQNNSKLRIDIKVNTQSISYDHFCEYLDKSEAFFHANNLVSKGVSHSTSSSDHVPQVPQAKLPASRKVVLE